jgi:hypothetical protein
VRRFSREGERLLATRPRQPDARSCGAACLVMERVLRDDAYAALISRGSHPDTGWSIRGDAAQRFRTEVLAMHRRTTSAVAVGGHLQVPWPRALGTPPWSLAGQLGADWSSRLWRRATPNRLDEVLRALDTGACVPLYVGTALLPRHVVLAVDAERHGGEVTGIWCYDPGTGGLRPMPIARLRSGRTGFDRWTHLWWAVLPR